MSQVDWSVLSGPYVSRRTMLKLAAATGATGFANWLVARNRAAAAPYRWSAAARAAAVQEAKPGGTLNWGFGLGQIPTLDPAQVNLGIVAGELLANLFSGLVQFDEQLGLIPDLAETWEVTPDGLQYTFRLRPGLTFHNGDPLTAEDVVYTYERTIDPAFAAPQANKLALITEITPQDELTVVIKQSAPYAPFLATACSRGPGRALQPVPRNAVEEMGPEQFGITPVGSGPFRLVPETAEVGRGFEMVAFDGWYGGRPYLDKVVVQLISEQSSRISALEAGDVDMLDIVPASGVEQVKGMDDVTYLEAAGTNWNGLSINQARPPWDKVEARMAVAKAIDRQDFIERSLFGLATPSVGPLAPAFGWVYRPPEEVDDPQAFNLDEAKALAEQAGLNGLKPIFIASSDNPRDEEVLRGILADIGLDVQIEQSQAAAYVERRTAGDFDFAINGSVVDADPDDGVWNYFHSEGPSNSYAYNNPRADELCDGQRATADPEERRQLLQELQSVVAADVAFAFLYHEPDRTAFYNYVQGYVSIPEQRYLEKVWLDK